MKFAVVLACLGLNAFAMLAHADLVSNGDFSNSASGKPAGWTVVETAQKISVEKIDDKNALQIEIVKEDGESLGEIRQTIKVKPNSKYRFSGEVKSSKAGQALFMLKPRAGRKELARITTPLSTTEWNAVTKDFEIGEANEVQVLCRYVQKPDSVGATSWFRNVSLVQLDAQGNPLPDSAPPAPAVERKAPAPVSPKVASAGTDQFVTPEGAGDKSGKDLANARPANALQQAIDSAGPGNTVFIGSGTYDNLALTISAGGSSESAIKSIVGKDTGAGLPLFKSNFNKTNPGKSGKTIFSVEPGVGHLAIRDIQVQAARTAVALKGTNVGIIIQNVDVTESRDAIWIEGKATPGDPNSGSRNITVQDCDFKYFTKRGVRIFDGVSNVNVTNCRADAGGKDWFTEPFAICFQVIGGDNGVIDRDITFTDCVAENVYHDPGPDKSYWNGDGFCTEGAVQNVTWIRCSAFNNTDGGWDIKNPKPKLIDCIAVDNKRNFRIWLKPGEAGAVLENCLSAYSEDRGDRKHDVGFWFLAGGDATMTRCTAYGDRVAVKVEGKDKPATTNLTLDHCLIQPKSDGAATSLYDGTVVKNNGSVLAENGKPPVELKSPRDHWRGGDESFNAKSQPDVGYRFPQPK